MTHENRVVIFDILAHRGMLSSSMQKVVTGFMEQWGVDAFKAIVETHLVEEGQMAEILAQELKLPRLTRVRILNVAKEILSLIPYNLALDLVVFPFDLTSDGHLHVVFADPSDKRRVDQIRTVTGKKIEVFVGERSEIIASIQRQYPLSMQLPTLMSVGRQTNGEG